MHCLFKEIPSSCSFLVPSSWQARFSASSDEEEDQPQDKDWHLGTPVGGTCKYSSFKKGTQGSHIPMRLYPKSWTWTRSWSGPMTFGGAAPSSAPRSSPSTPKTNTEGSESYMLAKWRPALGDNHFLFVFHPLRGCFSDSHRANANATEAVNDMQPIPRIRFAL